MMAWFWSGMIRFRLAPRDEAKMWKDAEASCLEWNQY